MPDCINTGRGCLEIWSQLWNLKQYLGVCGCVLIEQLSIHALVMVLDRRNEFHSWMTCSLTVEGSFSSSVLSSFGTQNPNHFTIFSFCPGKGHPKHFSHLLRLHWVYSWVWRKGGVTHGCCECTRAPLAAWTAVKEWTTLLAQAIGTSALGFAWLCELHSCCSYWKTGAL